MPSVAIVILNWNGQMFLKQFLPSVLAATYPNQQIILADNASTDESVAFVEKHFPSIRIIRLQENLGFAGGYNAALEQVEADYFILLNQDVEVTKTWISPLVEMMESKPGIAACQPKLRAWHDKEKFEYAGGSGGMMDALGYTFCRGRILDDTETDHGQYDDSIPVFWASGAALMIRAKLYHDFGGLESHFFAHMEEIDLCWRLKNAGYQIMAIPASVVYHVGGGSLPHGNPKKIYLNFRNSLLMFLRNMPLAKLLWFMPLRTGLDWLAACKALFAGRPKECAAILKAQISICFRPALWLNLRRKARKAVKRNRIGQADRSGYYKGSLLWQYFVKGVKSFDKLQPERFNR